MTFFRVEKRFSGKSGVNQTLPKELVISQTGINQDNQFSCLGPAVRFF
tara:strand:- start:339 stop:482 length:144 start_codon:yes stop_codon:yes gene_type:complete